MQSPQSGARIPTLKRYCKKKAKSLGPYHIGQKRTVFAANPDAKSMISFWLRAGDASSEQGIFESGRMMHHRDVT
jgi:hypothetical protein